jgi:hypothetical protein
MFSASTSNYKYILFHNCPELLIWTEYALFAPVEGKQHHAINNHSGRRNIVYLVYKPVPGKH